MKAIIRNIFLLLLFYCQSCGDAYFYLKPQIENEDNVRALGDTLQINQFGIQLKLSGIAGGTSFDNKRKFAGNIIYNIEIIPEQASYFNSELFFITDSIGRVFNPKIFINGERISDGKTKITLLTNKLNKLKFDFYASTGDGAILFPITLKNLKVVSLTHKDFISINDLVFR